jgi:pimeloyl-ACP methyl ester carboxylesterase
MPSLQRWPRRSEDLRRISARALSVVNEESDWPGFRETHEALLARVPNIEATVVPDCGHLLQIERPAPVAGAVGNFLSAGA